jgi:predicted lipoprotein with Yx(FWY)xxD motif
VVHTTRVVALMLLTLALAACGGDNADGPPVPAAGSTDGVASETTTEPGTTAVEASGEELARRPAGEDGLRVAAERAQIVAADSQFGRVLFDANGQVVYAFEQDRPNDSNCVSADCVRAWPPVLTKEAPTAGDGVDGGLLGTIRRDDGSQQVTYKGRPLYFYEHEGPGDIRCHNVNLHGGLWWVVTPSGENAA